MNGPLSPKQQEIREREQAILRVAAPMLIAYGYQGLSMDRIAAELRYAKGTIYNHFPNKEEIILSLSLEAIRKRQEMFDRAAVMRGTSRDRIQAIGVAFELYVRSYPDQFRVEQAIRHDVIWEKGSEKRRDLLIQAEQECMSMLAGIVRDGIASGDLACSESEHIEEMLFGLWALTFGSYVLHETSPSLSQLGISDVYRSIRVNSHRLLNGIPWLPVRELKDDLDRFEKVAKTIFPKEYSQLTRF